MCKLRLQLFGPGTILVQVFLDSGACRRCIRWRYARCGDHLRDGCKRRRAGLRSGQDEARGLAFTESSSGTFNE